MNQWRPVSGHELLEMDGTGRFRRIPTVRDPKTFALKPHPTKRIVLSAEEVAALGIDGPPADDITKAVSAGPAAPVLSGRRRG